MIQMTYIVLTLVEYPIFVQVIKLPFAIHVFPHSPPGVFLVNTYHPDITKKKVSNYYYFRK